jgi:hypothetical protein
MAKNHLWLNEILCDTKVIPPKPAPILPLSIEFLKTFSQKKRKRKQGILFHFINKFSGKQKKEKFGFISG